MDQYKKHLANHFFVKLNINLPDAQASPEPLRENSITSLPDRSDMADLDNDSAEILSVPAKYMNLG